MLPSTGYFKTINCPFYDSGSCDRPYCHFKHARREDAGSAAGVAGAVEDQTTGQAQENKSADVASNPDMLQQLVSEAVKKVLADQKVTDTEQVSQNIVSQVVEGLKPTLASNSAASVHNVLPNIIGRNIAMPATIAKPNACVYNPTPIAELKKRHIPVVSYMPTRESRVAVKRKSSPEGIKPWLSIVHEFDNSQPSEVTYKPTAIVNQIDQNAGNNYMSVLHSDASSNSFEGSSNNLFKPKEEYHPKSKKRREEYVPKKVKAPLKTVVQQLNDSTLDGYKSDTFDMIDEVFASNIASNSLEQELSNDSQEYSLDIEPKFSDDESIEDISKSKNDTIVKKTEQIEDKIEKEKENLQCASTKAVNKQSSNKDNTISNNHYDKTSDAESNDKSKHREAKNEDKSSERKKDSTNKSTDKKKERRDGHSKSRERDRKDRHSSERRDKEKSRHKSDSRDRHRSSSSKNKDRKKSDRNKSSHRSREHSDSRKHRHVSSKKERNDHKSSQRDKHRSSSSSKSSKRTSSKSDRKYHSESSQKSDDSSKKSSRRKESNSEDKSSDRSSDGSASSIYSVIDDEILGLSDSDHDIQEECLKIFQEYQPCDQSKLVSLKKERQEIENTEDIGKKRIAHPSAATNVTRNVGSSQPQKKVINPQLRMYERWRFMKAQAAEMAAEKAAANANTHSPQVTSASAVHVPSTARKEYTEITSSISNNDVQSNTNGRVRIAHVPYAKSLALEKKKVTEAVVKSADNKIETKTVAQTTKRTRVAHIPQTMPQLIRSEPLQGTTQKFPINVRQYYLNLMHDVCVQIYTNGDDASQRAVKEEFACHEKCKALAVYKNSCMLAIHKLKKEVDQNKPDEKSGGLNYGMVSHEAMLAGKSKGSWSVIKNKRNLVDIKGPAFYNILKKWILTETQLRDNGFPRKHPDGIKGRAKIYIRNARNEGVLSKVPNERICSRCGQTYMVDKHGFAVLSQNCIYHWGRKFTFRGESKYSCCQQFGSASGCCDAKTHVWDYTDYENLRGYVTTLSKGIPTDEQGIYALDCEMCYTTQGLELTRVTVIDEDCKVIYETLVKPQNSIIDYNTRFSGITEEDMKDVTTTILDVQATLLTMFSDKTILVGHSLESDFKALKLLHDTVVDTSVMFPHKNGYPQKRALKNLCSEYLKKIIQNDINGHDSNEDAVACMELVKWKVKEEVKLQ